MLMVNGFYFIWYILYYRVLMDTECKKQFAIIFTKVRAYSCFTINRISIKDPFLYPFIRIPALSK